MQAQSYFVSTQYSVSFCYNEFAFVVVDAMVGLSISLMSPKHLGNMLFTRSLFSHIFPYIFELKNLLQQPLTSFQWEGKVKTKTNKKKKQSTLKLEDIFFCNKRQLIFRLDDFNVYFIHLFSFQLID